MEHAPPYEASFYAWNYYVRSHVIRGLEICLHRLWRSIDSCFDDASVTTTISHPLERSPLHQSRWRRRNETASLKDDGNLRESQVSHHVAWRTRSVHWISVRIAPADGWVDSQRPYGGVGLSSRFEGYSRGAISGQWAHLETVFHEDTDHLRHCAY